MKVRGTMTTQNVADDPQSGNVNLSLEEKLARFGEHGIPLIVPWGTKGGQSKEDKEKGLTPPPFQYYMPRYEKRTAPSPYMFGYQKRTREDTLVQVPTGPVLQTPQMWPCVRAAV